MSASVSRSVEEGSDSERLRYYTPTEVSSHNVSSDCWVSYLGKVYDLTPLCQDCSGDVLLKPIVVNAGKDISHWFDPETHDIKAHMHPVASRKTPYTPEGRFVHIPPVGPRSDWSSSFGRPWWKEDRYCIGVLSLKTRKIRLLNSLTLEEQTVEICAEETLREIMKRYTPYNSHAGSYTWKYFDKNMDMDKTLDDNGVTDESDEFFELGMDEDDYLPPITLYFNDDLTEA